jgi:hypothetical protein
MSTGSSLLLASRFAKIPIDGALKRLDQGHLHPKLEASTVRGKHLEKIHSTYELATWLPQYMNT